MAKTSIEVPDIGTVYISKKRGQRTMRLRVDNKGQVQVSLPWMVPKIMAIDFIKSKRDWIKQQQASYHFKPYDGMLLGKTLRLSIKQNSLRQRTERRGSDIVVHFAGDYQTNNKAHIAKIEKAIMAALRIEAERVLLPRLQEFAEMYGFNYKSASVKQVIGRWGSCDSNKHIALSLYLIQLPIEYIDYVLIHELAHTKHMNHSPAFWSEVAKHCPEYKNIRKKMRGMRPKIYDAKTFMS